MKKTKKKLAAKNKMALLVRFDRAEKARLVSLASNARLSQTAFIKFLLNSI